MLFNYNSRHFLNILKNGSIQELSILLYDSSLQRKGLQKNYCNIDELIFAYVDFNG